MTPPAASTDQVTPCSATPETTALNCFVVFRSTEGGAEPIPGGAVTATETSRPLAAAQVAAMQNSPWPQSSLVAQWRASDGEQAATTSTKTLKMFCATRRITAPPRKQEIVPHLATWRRSMKAGRASPADQSPLALREPPSGIAEVANRASQATGLVKRVVRKVISKVVRRRIRKVITACTSLRTTPARPVRRPPRAVSSRPHLAAAGRQK